MYTPSVNINRNIKLTCHNKISYGIKRQELVRSSRSNKGLIFGFTLYLKSVVELRTKTLRTVRKGINLPKSRRND